MLILALLCVAAGPRRGGNHPPPAPQPDQPQQEPEAPTTPTEVIHYIDVSAWVGLMWYSAHSAQQPGYCPFIPSPGFSGFSGWPAAGDIPPGGEFASLVGRPVRHHGVDIWNDEGTPVTAPAAGYVVWAGGGDDIRGLGVAISHGYGFSAYGHVRDIYVTCGQWVNVGDTIATIGHTGLGNHHTNHLHWMLVDAARLTVDPLDFLIP